MKLIQSISNNKISLHSFSQDDKIEQEIVDLFMGSLKLCDTQTRNTRQILYVVRTGLIYQCLGNIYTQAYKSSGRGNGRRKKLVTLCHLYYEKSVKTFNNVDAFVDLLGVQVDRLELQNILFEGRKIF